MYLYTFYIVGKAHKKLYLCLWLVNHERKPMAQNILQMPARKIKNCGGGGCGWGSMGSWF